MTDTEIFLLADDFKSTSMACGVMVDDFDAIGFARAIEKASRRAPLEECEKECEGWFAADEVRSAIRQLAEGGKHE